MQGTILPPAPDVKVCAGCHTPNAPTSQYCYKCGLKLPEALAVGTEVIMFYGGFWRRLSAFLIDSLLIGIVYFLMLIILSPELRTGGSVSDQIIGISTLSTIIAGPLYWTVSIGKWGKSFGKLALGLKVVRVDGSQVSYLRAFARFCAYSLSYLTWGIGFLIIAFNRKKRGLHDYICDTVVIRHSRRAIRCSS
jgi:uncharacterized RDD family membrane protein YckC